MVANRTDTVWFRQLVWGKAWAVMFLHGRIKYHNSDGSLAGSSMFGTVLAAYSRLDALRLKNSGLDGQFFPLEKLSAYWMSEGQQLMEELSAESS